MSIFPQVQQPETIHDRELRPLVEREVMSTPMAPVNEDHEQILADPKATTDELRSIISELRCERDEFLKILEQYQALIEHQYSSTREGMTALQLAMDAGHDALLLEAGK